MPKASAKATAAEPRIRPNGEVFRGRVPPYSVVVPGAVPDPNGGPSLYAAVIVKRVDAQTRAKTGVNELLRE